MDPTDNLPPADVPVPPPFDGLPERCAAIPWDIRGNQVFRGFWKTVWLSMVHPGRLGELIDQPVGLKEAREFRKMAVMHFATSIIATSAIQAIRLFENKKNITDITVILIVGCPIAILLSWLFVRFLIGTSRWFFYPGHLSPRRQETSLALSYYLAGPLALTTVSWLGLFPLAINHPIAQAIAQLLASLPMLAALVWYYVAVVIGLRSIARRRGANLVMSSLGVAGCWIAVWVSFLLVPTFIAMWLLMYGSLS